MSSNVEKIAVSEILPQAYGAVQKLKEVIAYFDSIDALGSELSDWEYLQTRFFTEESNEIFQLVSMLEQEFIPEAEDYFLN
ncbi:hypothetical protein QP940_04830 [Corynebacterium pseudodiphtheriticum]|uniref:hypothetical protein n=1 Tax=Corynebacterium TaxID=1716 RepID=UPI00234C9BB1|nr:MULTISPECIES: hypothetical protein [Corynebacterium]MDC7111019.1 hypothetical protein [Corynebacterium pseudodiphtheriticum]MDC7112249.1 hypothetical protein [Corynebacterium pseudodiphtheriticum]MDC7114975.1 hypothetical protein [Corynebacterium pseudodiphtheriticum]MDK4242457.1 hypothetical protein [Corynebacterium pseudodiphtheriticum]MDK4277405.1 hypothetical protein [Corynebacterium pseudodiphtheriticum]